MSAPNGTFSLFPEFPAEIRLAIWRDCLPLRVVELDDQLDDLTWDESPCNTNWKITRTNNAPPVIAHICRESRAVAFETGRPQQLSDAHDAVLQLFSNHMVDSPWLDAVRDSVHLNWEPFVDIEWQSYDWGDPVRYLMRCAARTRSCKASIMLGLLQTFQYRDSPDQPHEHYRWTRCELADLMRTRPSWTVVILAPVVVHADAATAAGLFGLLADARVQLVDADDKERINEFLALCDAPGVTAAARFRQEDLVSARQKLLDAVRAVFGSEDSAPTMCAAVMFRLCTSICV